MQRRIEMDDTKRSTKHDTLRPYLTAQVSRAQLLAAGAGLAIAALPGSAAADGSPRPDRLEFPFFPQVKGTYTPESIQDIFNLLDTFEHAGIAYHADILSRASQIGLTPFGLAIEQADIAIAQYHVDFLESVGAHSLTDTFTFRTPVTTAAAVFGGTEFGTSFLLASYMTAVREFAELGQPLLVKYAYQMGATWAEHRALARALLAQAGVASEVPPNNKAFATDHFVYVRDVYRFLQRLGLFGANAITLTVPGRAAALALAGPMASGVLQKAPNNAIVSTSAPDVRAFLGERGATP
jgi:hypothetical protein